MAVRLPRWRGFNLLEKFIVDDSHPFREEDFAWMAELGFDFARLPLDYHCWTAPARWEALDESVLREVDQAVEYGRRHGVHVNLNFHRAPGYCVNPPAEPFSLWSDERALEACAYHWAHFARRYRGIPNEAVSFDLLNEPPDVAEAEYERVVRWLVAAIRAEDPERLIIVDGLRWGREPVFSIVDLDVGQSTRGYDPSGVSHYRASWVEGAGTWPVPTWPGTDRRGRPWDVERLRRELIRPWKDLESRGAGVHVGEWGAYRFTPHDVVMRWMRDCLELWREAGWGWALWNFRGPFGVLNSGRSDVEYEPFRGHELDREMLDLLREY